MLLLSVFLFYFVSQYIDIRTCWTWSHTPLVPTSLKFSERKEHIKCSSFCYCWCFHCHELNPAKCYMILPLSRPEVLHFSGNIWHVPSASVIAVSPVPGSPVELWNIFTIWSWNIFTNHIILIREQELFHQGQPLHWVDQPENVISHLLYWWGICWDQSKFQSRSRFSGIRYYLIWQ